MLKYLNSDIVFQEVPGEVTLAINITGCPCRCPGCHSPALWDDLGITLNKYTLEKLIQSCNSHITCIALMGGDARTVDVNTVMKYIKTHHKELKTAWYSGRSILPPAIDINNFDYIKLGPYLSHLGPLKSRTTNQRFYKVVNGEMIDNTSLFWRQE